MSVLKKLGSGISDYIRNTDKLLLFFCALASVYGCMLVYSRCPDIRHRQGGISDSICGLRGRVCHGHRDFQDRL